MVIDQGPEHLNPTNLKQIFLLSSLKDISTENNCPQIPKTKQNKRQNTHKNSLKVTGPRVEP